MLCLRQEEFPRLLELDGQIFGALVTPTVATAHSADNDDDGDDDDDVPH